jgi:hypothetical protein
LIVMRLSPEPNRVPSSAATAMTRNAVRLSGAAKVKRASPRSSVTRCGAQNADDTKRERMRPPSPEPESPPSSGSSSPIGLLSRAIRFQLVPASTPRPQLAKKACIGSGVL